MSAAERPTLEEAAQCLVDALEPLTTAQLNDLIVWWDGKASGIPELLQETARRALAAPTPVEPAPDENEAIHTALDSLGDDEGQGLDGYWKTAFLKGWEMRARLSPLEPTEPGRHIDGSDRFKVVRGSYWWSVRIGDGQQTVGKFHTEKAAEDLAFQLLRAFRDGHFAAALAVEPGNPATNTNGNFVHPSPTLRQEPVAADEVGWLIEHSGALPGAETGSVSWLFVQPKFEGYGAQELSFTHDASKALRFARKVDAEAVLKMHLGMSPPDWYSKPFSVTEHMWAAGSADGDQAKD